MLRNFLVYLLVFQSFWGIAGISDRNVNPERNPEIKKIAGWFSLMRNASSDSLKRFYNDSIVKQIDKLPDVKDLKNNLFDSVHGLVEIYSDDRLTGFWIWNIQWQDGHHQYFGFLMTNYHGEIRKFFLTDKSSETANPESGIFNVNNWFGALYYKIITITPPTGLTYYTLLGWSGKDNLVTRKVIEVFSFSQSGIPEFGSAIFENYPKPECKRIIFSYSAGTSMSLKFETQVTETSRKWNKEQRVFNTKEFSEQIIVADRLAPMDQLMEGQYQFYLPVGDIQDGFALRNGHWNFIQGIESRNKK